MTYEQRRGFLAEYSMALANNGFLKPEEVAVALDDHLAKLESKIPLCLTMAGLNDPPPPNWRAWWTRYSR